MTIVAHSYRQRGLNENQTCCGPFRAREGLVQSLKGYVVQQHQRSGLQQATPKNSHIQAERGVSSGGNTIPDPWFLLIGGLDSQQTAFNGARRTLGHTDILACVWCLCPSQPSSPNPLASPLGGVGIGVLHASRHPALFLLLFFIHVIGWSGDVLILESYQESPCEFSSATHPWGLNPLLIGTQRACLDYDCACKYTCSIFLVPFYHNIYIVSIFKAGVWKFCD